MEKGETYKNPYLNEVIFRINFSNILHLSGNNKEAAELFRKHIFEKFPEVNIKQNHEFKIGFGENTGEPQITQEGNLIWIFQNKQQNKIVELSATSLILNYKKNVYVHFRDFLEDIILIIDALKIYSPIKLDYLGFRYINQITGKSISELEKCIDPNYFEEYINNLDDDEEFIQILNRLSLIKDSYVLNFQYGLFNPAFPNPTFDKDFILDFDCVNKNINSLEEVPEELKKMNFIIWKKFDEAITEKLKHEMKEE